MTYFSFYGRTERAARLIAEEIGADLCRITPKEPYTEDDLSPEARRSPASRVNTEDRDPACRPEVEAPERELGQYGTIFIGTPVWFGHAPKAVLSFIEANRAALEGKTVIVFCTSASSEIRETTIERDIRGALPKVGKFVIGSAFHGEITRERAISWLKTYF